MFVAGVVIKRKEFFSVLTLSERKKIHLHPELAGFMVNPNGICVMVVRNCMNIPKYTLTGTYLFQMEGG